MNEQNRLKSVSDLLKGAFEQYKKHFNSLVPIMLVAGVGLYLQSIFLFLGTPSLQVGSSMKVAGTYGILFLVSTVIYIVGMIWGTTALLNKVHKLDQPMTLGQAYSAAKPFIWPMIITGILVGIFTIIGFILLVIPGIIVGVWLSFSMYIVIAEGKSGMDAVKASKEYVTGYWWAVFGRLILVGLVVGIIAAVIGGICQAILGVQLGTLVQNVVSLVLTPLALLYQYSLYLDVKRAKSGMGSTPAPVSTPQAPVSTPTV